jgi:hypothetical protein
MPALGATAFKAKLFFDPVFDPSDPGPGEDAVDDVAEAAIFRMGQATEETKINGPLGIRERFDGGTSDAGCSMLDAGGRFFAATVQDVFGKLVGNIHGCADLFAGAGHVVPDVRALGGEQKFVGDFHVAGTVTVVVKLG